jgi:hypothetical protein
VKRREFITLLGIPKHNRVIKWPEGRRDTYVVEFRTANGELLAISIPRTEANVIKPFQARMPLWSGGVRHRSVQTKKKRRVYWPRGSVARSSCRTISKGERSITAMAGTPAQEEIDEPTGKFLRPRSEIAHFELLA